MPHKISEIARVIGGIVIGDENLEIMGIADIQQAREGEITFLANNRYRKYLKETAASAVIVPIDITEGEGKTLIQTDDPYLVLAVSEPYRQNTTCYPAQAIISFLIITVANVLQNDPLLIQEGKLCQCE